ncbi:MAG: laccase domain-containing protein [Bacteroidales bacterium]|nr:laccase domain-containing protein [Bacteroidales bacterium]
MPDGLLKYDLGAGVEAFTARRDSVLPYPVVQGHQVHDIRVAVVERWMTREELEGFDAFVTNVPGLAIGVRTADCVPVLLYDPVHRAVAAVHAGWKGTVKHISQLAIEVLTGRYGCEPSGMRAVIGPAIGPDSFQVGEEVVAKFREAGFPLAEVWSFRGQGDGSPMSGGHHIDLFKANRWLLEEAGIPAANISVCAVDTYTEVSLYSARREGTACGRNINSIRLI